MTVVESTVNGNVGKFFIFSGDEFSKMVGNDDWNNHQFEIIQGGSHSWEGFIKVWKDDDTPRGTKLFGAADGDWEKSDIIILKSCSNPGKMF